VNVVKRARMEKGWTQRALAIAANVGLSSVQRMEREEGQPSAETAMAVAGALGLDVGKIRRQSPTRRWLRQALARWQDRSPTSEELKAVPDPLRPQFEAFYEGMARGSQNMETIRVLSERLEDIHAKVMAIMQDASEARRRVYELTFTDPKAALALWERIKESDAEMSKLDAERDAVLAEVFATHQRSISMNAELIPLAARLDRELIDYGVIDG
jgi:transcriptional regulator with XRE-family HTH domain